ncbi:hypothetical protein [Nonomuraea sp. B19D2]
MDLDTVRTFVAAADCCATPPGTEPSPTAAQEADLRRDHIVRRHRRA